MKLKLLKSAGVFALLAGLTACANDPYMSGQGEAQRQAHYSDITEDNIQVFVNNPGQRFEVVRHLHSEVFVLDATSEEDAELRAFQQMLRAAKEAGADAVIEVRRSIVQDSIAQRTEMEIPAGSSDIFRDDMDPTAVTLDEMTLADYWRGVGTLSGARIDQTFGGRDLSQKSVVFTGKAIRFN